MIFELAGGTTIELSNKFLKIIRISKEERMKSILGGRAGGEMLIKISEITGIMFDSTYMVFFACGIPSPTNFSFSKIAEIKQLPNCIIGRKEELYTLYQEIIKLL